MKQRDSCHDYARPIETIGAIDRPPSALKPSHGHIRHHALFNKNKALLAVGDDGTGSTALIKQSEGTVALTESFSPKVLILKGIARKSRNGPILSAGLALANDGTANVSGGQAKHCLRPSCPEH